MVFIFILLEFFNFLMSLAQLTICNKHSLLLQSPMQLEPPPTPWHLSQTIPMWCPPVTVTSTYELIPEKDIKYLAISTSCRWHQRQRITGRWEEKGLCKSLGITLHCCLENSALDLEWRSQVAEGSP